jgi:dolichol-phosphate mannosyltransferase
MRALVTGAGGFIGANVVRHLLQTGHEAVAVLRPGGDRWRLADIADDVRYAELDLRDPEAVTREVIEQRPDVVLNLAAHGAYAWQQDLETMLAVNVRAMAALLAGARAVGARVVQAGSSSEYGFRGRATSEADRIEPNSDYAITKAAATHLCRLAAAQRGQHAITLRLYSVYGPWEEPGRLMPALVERALDGAYPPLVAPETARDFVWIEDVCDAFVRAATLEPADRGAVLNVATGAQTTLSSLVDIVRSLFEIGPAPAWGSMRNRSWDTSVWVGDPSAAAEAIGWTAATPLAQGLRALASWMQADPAVRARYRVPAASPGAGAGRVGSPSGRTA